MPIKKRATRKKGIKKGVRGVRGRLKSIASGGSYPIRGGKMRGGGTPYFINFPAPEKDPEKSGMEKLEEKVKEASSLAGEAAKLGRNVRNTLLYGGGSIALIGAGVKGAQRWYDPGEYAKKEAATQAETEIKEQWGYAKGTAKGVNDIIKEATGVDINEDMIKPTVETVKTTIESDAAYNASAPTASKMWHGVKTTAKAAIEPFVLPFTEEEPDFGALGGGQQPPPTDRPAPAPAPTPTPTPTLIPPTPAPAPTPNLRVHRQPPPAEWLPQYGPTEHHAPLSYTYDFDPNEFSAANMTASYREYSAERDAQLPSKLRERGNRRSHFTPRPIEKAPGIPTRLASGLYHTNQAIDSAWSQGVRYLFSSS